MENETKDKDCFRNFQLGKANQEVLETFTEESEIGNLKRASADDTAVVENAEISQSHSTFELEEKDEEPTATQQSTTAPGKPTATEIGCNLMKLEWEKPSERNISYYEILSKKVTDTSWSRPVFSEFDKPCYHVRSLEVDTEYEFKVRAHYQDKEGDFSQKSGPFKTKSGTADVDLHLSKHLTLKPGKPFALDVRDDHVQLGWDKPEERNVKFYEITIKSSTDEHWSRPLFTESGNTFFRVNRLAPEMEYTFKVRSHYNTFEGIFSDVSDPVKTNKKEPVRMLDTTPSSTRPGKPAALDVGFDYACIAWDKPDRRGIEYYEVKMKIATEEAWLKISSFTEDNKPYKKLFELASGTEYEFKVRGHFEGDHEGEFSEKSNPIMTEQAPLRKLSLETTPEFKVPMLRQPKKPYSLDIAEDYIVLAWDKPEETDVEYYELKTKNLQRKAWDKMPVFTDDPRTFRRIGGLSPSSKYVFKVRAHFYDGEGEFSDESDPVSTLDKHGVKGKEDHLMEEERIPTLTPPKEEHNFTKQLVDAALYPTKMHTNTTGHRPSEVRWDVGSRISVESGVKGGAQLTSLQSNYQSLDPGMTYIPDNYTTKRLTSCYNTLSAQDSMHQHRMWPSKPSCSDIKSDSVRLHWTYPEPENVMFYEVKYRPTQQQIWGKDPVSTKDNTPQVFIDGLLQDTSYTFKVRGHYKDGEEGAFSEQSDPIQTRHSPAIAIKSASTKLQDGEPAFYKLPIVENKGARNIKYKTRKCEFGSSDFLQEKTIMMIGATGSGKSTLIDGMVNHLMGVKWEDNFRFKIIDLMTEEEARKGLETESQTDWITSYRVHPKNGYVGFILNIIDTPGFGDTRGIERDHELVDQIRAFFSTAGIRGIETIDAICFVIQAPLARLTHTQKYIFEAILSIFGKNMEKNIVAMVTFADGKEPPVLNALNQAEVPYTMHFVFNNSALFEPNTEEKANRFGKMFWKMGCLSYGGFFHFLPHLTTQSLQLTAEVLEMREQLNATVDGLIPQIDIGLVNLATMKTERDLVEKFAREIEDNQNFTYKAKEFHQNVIPLQPGTYVTNCTFCHSTCHFPCAIQNDSEKSRCAAIKDGRCTVCPMHCSWNTHKNNDFRIEINEKEVQKTYLEMKKKFEFAEKEKVSKERFLQTIKNKFLAAKDAVSNMIATVRDCGNFLRQNALKSNPLTEVEYLDLLIKTATDEKKPGFARRIKMLKVLKRSAKLKAEAIRLNDTDELLRQLGFDDQ